MQDETTNGEIHTKVAELKLAYQKPEIKEHGDLYRESVGAITG